MQNVTFPAGFLREPTQDRSRESLRRVFDATNRLLQEKTFDKITVGEISAASSVSVGSIYQRFGSKDDLLWSLYGAYIAEASGRIQSLFDQERDRDLGARVDLLIRQVCSLFRKNHGIVKSLLLKYRQDPRQVPELHVRRIEKVYKAAEKFLQQACPADLPAKRVKFAFSLLMAACRERILFADIRGIGSTPRSDAEFSKVVGRAVSSVLLEGGE